MAAPAPRFSEMPYERPSLDRLRARHDELLSRWDEAASVEAQRELILEWDRGRIELDTSRAIAHVRYELDTRDAAARGEKEFFDDVGPELTELDLSFVRRVLDSAWLEQLEEQLGAQAFRLWAIALSAFDPAIADDRRRESRLGNRYTELLASIRVPFGGREVGLTTLASSYGEADRATRLEAQQARFAALDRHRAELDGLFDELVSLRHGMARQLGHDSFVPLGYRLMRRDYTPRDVESFRRQVRDVVVPLTSRIRARRAESLGITDPAFHDFAVRDPQGVPRPLGGAEWMVEQAQGMFAELGEDFATFFDVLRRRELMDLDSRDGKAGGGFCIDLSEHRVPFIFANFNGTEDDVNVFTHECGHAFQAWCSFDQPLSDYFVPTFDAAEIHSMGLEMLCRPLVERFFGEDAERFRAGHLERAVLFLPYGVAIDEFQHRVYEEPSLEPDERAELWKELEATYLPERRYVDMPFAESGRWYQVQRHVFLAPFYYVDYCLAQTCALQIWRESRRDREGAMDLYRRLCRLGGSRSFTGLLEEVGLVSPFAPGCLEDVIASVEEALGA